jgi:hypothetical protein
VFGGSWRRDGKGDIGGKMKDEDSEKKEESENELGWKV